MVGTLVVAFRVIAHAPEDSVLAVRPFFGLSVVTLPLLGPGPVSFGHLPGRTRAGARGAIAGRDAKPA